MAQGHLSTSLVFPETNKPSCQHWLGQCSQAASTKPLFQAPGTSGFPTGCPRARNALKTTNQPRSPRASWGKTHPELFFGKIRTCACLQKASPTGFSFLCWLFCPLSSLFCSVTSGWPTTAWGMQNNRDTTSAPPNTPRKTLWSPAVLKAPLLKHNFLKSKKFPAGKNFSWL